MVEIKCEPSIYQHQCIIICLGCSNGVPINRRSVLHIWNEETYQCARAESNLVWFEISGKRSNKSLYKSVGRQLNSSCMHKQIWHKQITWLWIRNKRDMAVGLWFFHHMIVCNKFTRDTNYGSILWIPEARNTHWMEIERVCISLHIWRIRIFSNYRSVCNKNQYTTENFCLL